MRRLFERLVSGDEPMTTALSRIQFQDQVGTLSAGLALAIATGIAVSAGRAGRK